MATSRHMGPLTLRAIARPRGPLAAIPISRRAAAVHVSAAPSTSTVHPPTDLSTQTRAIPKLSGAGPFPQDVQFEALGAPYSMLSVSLPSSATLYTRRGTLVGVNGNVENATSTLSVLEPVRRAALRIPFLYQKITSTSPLTCLISTNALHTSFAVIKLDGTIDWMVSQKKALLAWCGHSIAVKPTIDRKLSLSHWGNSKVSGRGLVALAGKGQIFQVVLQPGEEFIVHANNLLAYSLNTPLSPPTPHRLPATTLTLQIPHLRIPSSLSRRILPTLPTPALLTTLAHSKTYKTLARLAWNIRTWSRRTVFGDREFLRFNGPVTVLIQSRAGGTVRDVLGREEMRGVDAALAEPEVLRAVEGGETRGAIEDGTTTATTTTTTGIKTNIETKLPPQSQLIQKPKVSWAPAGFKAAYVRNGKVELEDATSEEFLKR
ncbi:mitochondrial biogenesis AIM24-domain-containing protein [Peziza echinospora]|nr:mitochondrial biogenesis AIM24-domain-containing protein [Peziza echinospora]